MPSGGGGSSGTTTTVQKSDPWEGQQPYLKRVLALSQGLTGGNTTNPNQFANSSAALQYYPGSTVAPFAPETETALQGQAQRALQGSPVEQAAQGQIAQTAGGAFLGAGNPYFSNMMDTIAGDVTSRVNSEFSGAGRYGSGAHQAAVSGALADTASKLAYGNYQQERQNQLSAASLAPQMAGLDYQNIAALGEVGAARENLAQQNINEDVERFNFQQQEPYNRLGIFNQLIQGNYGGTSTGTSTATQPRRSPLGGVLAGGGLGYKLDGTQGALLGAGAGGLLSYL